MKRLIFIALAMCAAAGTCRAERVLATPQMAADFFRTTTYVVLTNDNIVLDALMRQAVEKAWKATPYRIVDNAAFKELRTNPSNSFLLVTKVKNSSDKLQRHYLFLNLLLGDPKAAVDLDVMPELSSIPFTGDVTEPNAFLLEPVLFFLQRDVENMSNNMFEKRFRFSFEDRMKTYNKNMELLKSKTLSVAQTHIGAEVKQDNLPSQFGGKLSLVPEVDDLAKVVESGSETAVIAMTIFPENTRSGIFAYKYVIGLDGVLYYYYREKDSKRFKFHSGDFDMWLRAYKKGD